MYGAVPPDFIANICGRVGNLLALHGVSECNFVAQPCLYTRIFNAPRALCDVYTCCRKFLDVEIRKFYVYGAQVHIILLYFFNEAVCVVLLVSYKFLHLAHIYDILNPFSYNRIGAWTICN